MNALRKLISGYLADNPGESYASIGRRGSVPNRPLPRSTVHSLATKPSWRQAPQVSTLAALALGMDMSPEVVRAAAADAAGYGAGGVPSEIIDGRTCLVADSMKHRTESAWTCWPLAPDSCSLRCQRNARLN